MSNKPSQSKINSTQAFNLLGNQQPDPTMAQPYNYLGAMPEIGIKPEQTSLNGGMNPLPGQPSPPPFMEGFNQNTQKRVQPLIDYFQAPTIKDLQSKLRQNPSMMGGFGQYYKSKMNLAPRNNL